MITALLLSLLFIIVASAFLFFLLHILYPSLEQQNFPMKDPLVLPWPKGWPEVSKKSLFLFNSSADCRVVRLIHSGKGNRQDLRACFEECVDICPRLNFNNPSRTCPFEQEIGAKHAKQYRTFSQRLSAVRKKFQKKSPGET